MIQSIKYSQGATLIVTLDDGSILSVPDDMTNRHRRYIEKWLDEGNTPEPADPEPPPAPDLTNDFYSRLRTLKGTSEIVDQLIDVMTGVDENVGIAVRSKKGSRI